MSTSQDTTQGPVRVGIVGTGFSGLHIHAPLISQTEGVAIGAFVARSAEGRRRAATLWPDVPAVPAISDLGDDIDVVIIATTDADHAELAEQSLRAGFATVVDKPLATSALDARRLAGLAQERGLLLTAFHNRRWDSDFLTLTGVLSRIGQPVRLESTIQRWAPDPGRTWRNQRTGGPIDGLLGGVATHMVDQAIVAFGPVRSVYGEVDTVRAGAQVNDDVMLALHHENGVRSHLRSTTVASTATPRFRVQGSIGGAAVAFYDPQQEALAAGALPGSDGWGSPSNPTAHLVVDEKTSAIEPTPGDWRAFYTRLRPALLLGQRPPVDLHDVLHGLDVLEAARVSSEQRVLVSIPRSEQHPG